MELHKQKNGTLSIVRSYPIVFFSIIALVVGIAVFFLGYASYANITWFATLRSAGNHTD